MTDQLLLVGGCLIALRIPGGNDDDDDDGDGQRPAPPQRQEQQQQQWPSSLLLSSSSLSFIFVVVICDHDLMTPNPSSTIRHHKQNPSTMTELTVVDNDPSTAGHLPEHAVHCSCVMVTIPP